MQENIERALNKDSLVDITTTGRKTSLARRIEIGFQYIENTIFISGLPGKRGWYANLLAKPAFTFHLKQSVQADIPAVATPIIEAARRRQVLTIIVAKWKRSDKIEAFVKSSPLIEVYFSEMV